MPFTWNQLINIMYPSVDYPFFLAPYKKKLDSIHRRSSSCFKDKLWFQIKQRLKMLFSRNQRINILYPNENYLFVLSQFKNKLDSIHERSSSRFMDKLWFQTKWRLQILFLWNQHINIMYPNENYPFVGPSRKESRFYPQTKFILF